MEQKQGYLFECEKCGNRFYLGRNGIEIKHEVPFKTKDGRSIYITYYDCPKCGRRHYVQIDDVHSNKMKKETLFMFRKLSKKRLDYKDIPVRQNEKFKKLNKKLEDYRLELKKELNGCMVIAQDGSDIEVHFSM